jgi:hypothetical protein
MMIFILVEGTILMVCTYEAIHYKKDEFKEVINVSKKA